MACAVQVVEHQGSPMIETNLYSSARVRLTAVYVYMLRDGVQQFVAMEQYIAHDVAFARGCGILRGQLQQEVMRHLGADVMGKSFKLVVDGVELDACRIVGINGVNGVSEFSYRARETEAEK